MDLNHLLVQTFVHIPPASAISDLSDADAMRRLAGSHSIAEIVAHMDYWQGWFLKRCQGQAEPMASSAAQGWPEVPDGAWSQLRERFLAGAARAAEFTAEAQAGPVSPPIEFPPLAHYTIGNAMFHVAQHNSHHIGQIVTLRQVMGLWPPAAGSWTW